MEITSANINEAAARMIEHARQLAQTPSKATGGRRKTPKACACECGGMTKGGNWLPGHDATFLSKALAMERARIAAETRTPKVTTIDVFADVA